MRENKKIVLLLLLIFFLFQANSVFALEILYPKVPGAITPQEIEQKIKDGKIEEADRLPLYFKYFFNLSLIVVTIICVAVSIYGGVLFLISGGSPVTMADAKKWIFSGILGLAILFSSYLLLVTINPQLVIFEIPGITQPPEELPPTISPPTVEKTIYQEVPIGTLVENILAKNIDCYDYDSEGNMVDADTSTSSPGIDKMKNHDRLDCLKKLAEAVRRKSEELKKLAEELKALTDQCKCSNCFCACPACVPTPCSGDPCEPTPGRGAIDQKREEIKQLVTGEGKGEEFLSIRKGIERLKEAKKLLDEDLNNLIEAENLMKWKCQYGTILNLVKYFDFQQRMEYIDKTEFDNIDMRKYCIEFNCKEFENEDNQKKKVCTKYELATTTGRICKATTTPTAMEYYVFDGDPATFYCLTGEETTAAGLAPVLLKTCAEQGGIPCNPGQICEGGYLSGSSDYGVSAGKFSWAGTKLVYGWHDRFNVDQILAAGFNTVVTYRLLDASDQNFLDECLQKGLWVLPYIGGFFPNNVNGAINYVNTWKNHPAIGAWSFLDEPELHGYTKAEQQDWYNAIKAVDPGRDFFTAFTTNPAHPTDAFNPNAFDHCLVDIYPINDECFRYGPGEWNGNWQGYMDYSLNRWNSLTGGIGGTAIVQAYYAPQSGMLNPSGYIGGMLNAFQAHGAGTQKDGYGMYAWGGTDGTYLPQDSAVLSEVTSVNAGYDWPHVSSPRGEEARGNALCCVGGTCVNE